MFMSQQRIKLLIQRTDSVRKWNVYLINSIKYSVKILFGDFSATVGKEDIFKPTVGNKSFT
jgi:hypothetical protein